MLLRVRQWCWMKNDRHSVCLPQNVNLACVLELIVSLTKQYCL